jgi:hypothetical protein
MNDLKSSKSQWHAENQIEDDWKHLWYQMRQCVTESFLEIVVHCTTFFDTVHNGRKVVVHQTDVCRLFCYFAA